MKKALRYLLVIIGILLIAAGIFAAFVAIRGMPDGSVIHSRNLTIDEETGIGKWSEEDFVKAVITGIIPNGPGVRPPMKPYTYLSDGEVKAVYAYLKTIPKIKNKVERKL